MFGLVTLFDCERLYSEIVKELYLTLFALKSSPSRGVIRAVFHFLNYLRIGLSSFPSIHIQRGILILVRPERIVACLIIERRIELSPFHTHKTNDFQSAFHCLEVPCILVLCSLPEAMINAVCLRL